MHRLTVVADGRTQDIVIHTRTARQVKEAAHLRIHFVLLGSPHDHCFLL